MENLDKFVGPNNFFNQKKKKNIIIPVYVITIVCTLSCLFYKIREIFSLIKNLINENSDRINVFSTDPQIQRVWPQGGCIKVANIRSLKCSTIMTTKCIKIITGEHKTILENTLYDFGKYQTRQYM